MHFTRCGWPSRVPADLKPFHSRREELTVEGDCLLWGVRVVVPAKLRARILSDLHRDHGGIVRMKAMARSYMWWLGMDTDIESVAKSCVSCKAVKSAPQEAPLHPWVWPTEPWKRIHVDFAGPFQGKMFFLVIDAHSKWPEIFRMSSTTVQETIVVLRRIFASFGLPDQLVSDNGPQFTAREFADFVSANGIRHIRTAPYHPASNGAIERFVQTFKQAMKAGEGNGLSFQHRLQSLLMSYRSTPHATTGKSPASLFWEDRTMRTRFDLMRPVVGEKVGREQARQKQHHDTRARFRQFAVGTRVMVREGRDKSVWTPGTILERRGPVSYLVQMDGGQMQRKHVDHIRELFTPPAVITSEVATGPSTVESSRAVPLEDVGDAVPDPNQVEHSMPVTEPPEVPPPSEVPDVPSVPRGPNRTPVRTYPRRQRTPVDRFTCT